MLMLYGVSIMPQKFSAIGPLRLPIVTKLEMINKAQTRFNSLEPLQHIRTVPALVVMVIVVIVAGRTSRAGARRIEQGGARSEGGGARSTAAVVFLLFGGAARFHGFFAGG